MQPAGIEHRMALAHYSLESPIHPDLGPKVVTGSVSLKLVFVVNADIYVYDIFCKSEVRVRGAYPNVLIWCVWAISRRPVAIHPLLLVHFGSHAGLFMCPAFWELWTFLETVKNIKHGSNQFFPKYWSILAVIYFKNFFTYFKIYNRFVKHTLNVKLQCSNFIFLPLQHLVQL